MRKAGLIVTIALVSLAAGDVAHAQTPTSGTVTVTGTTPEALSLTNESDATVSSTIALGTLTPGTSNTLTTGQTTIRLRSNKAYKVTAQAAPLSVTGPGSADGEIGRAHV